MLRVKLMVKSFINAFKNVAGQIFEPQHWRFFVLSRIRLHTIWCVQPLVGRSSSLRCARSGALSCTMTHIVHICLVEAPPLSSCCGIVYSTRAFRLQAECTPPGRFPSLQLFSFGLTRGFLPCSVQAVLWTTVCMPI